MKMARDTWLIFQRHMVIMLRTPIWIVVGITQPVFYLLLFAPLLKPALAPLGTTTNSQAYGIFVPGLLVLMVIYGGLFTGFGLIAELRSGIIERCRVTPLSRLALILGRSLRDVASIMVQCLIITVVALPLGLAVALPLLLPAYLILALIALMASAVSYGVALLVRSEAVLGPIINTVAQPIALLSGVFLPMAFAPVWLQNIAAWNPFAWAVDGVRALFAGDGGDSVVWRGLAFMTVLTVAAVVWSARLFTKAVR